MVHVQNNMVLSRYVFIEVPLCNMLEQYQPSFFVLSLVTLKYLEYHCLKYLEYYLNTIEHEHSNYSVLLLGVGGTYFFLCKYCCFVQPLPRYTSKYLCEPSDTHCNSAYHHSIFVKISFYQDKHIALAFVLSCECP